MRCDVGRNDVRFYFRDLTASLAIVDTTVEVTGGAAVVTTAGDMVVTRVMAAVTTTTVVVTGKEAEDVVPGG